MKPSSASSLIIILAALAVPGSPVLAAADSEKYPARPIRLIVPQAPGGSNDIMARYVANHLTTSLGKQVVVDNRPGAEGIIGTEMVARSSPDGYTLLMASAAFTMNPAVRKLPYDPLRAFDWVAMLGTGPTVLTVGPSLPVTTVKDVIAIAKSKPGTITMATAGGFQHFGTALFRSLSGCDFIVVLYKGGFPAMIDVMGGQAHMTVGSIVQSIPHIRSGKLKPLATGGATRAATLPDLPTIAEAGVPGYDASNFWALATAAGTPYAAIATLNTEVNKLLATPEMKAAIIAQGAEPQSMTPEQFETLLKSDYEKWKGIVQASGATIE